MMRLLLSLWHDESGFIVSAELVTICTLGVIGGVVGLNVAGKAVDDELTDIACALRSLDQSYSYSGHQGCRAQTAGSSFQQEAVEISLKKLKEQSKEQEKAASASRKQLQERLNAESRK